MKVIMRDEIVTQAEKPDAILKYRNWTLRIDGSGRSSRVHATKPLGDHHLMSFKEEAISTKTALSLARKRIDNYERKH